MKKILLTTILGLGLQTTPIGAEERQDLDETQFTQCIALSEKFDVASSKYDELLEKTNSKYDSADSKLNSADRTWAQRENIISSNEFLIGVINLRRQMGQSDWDLVQTYNSNVQEQNRLASVYNSKFDSYENIRGSANRLNDKLENQIIVTNNLKSKLSDDCYNSTAQKTIIKKHCTDTENDSSFCNAWK